MWKPFFFESNQFFKMISSPDDWFELRAAYPELSDSQLLEAKKVDDGQDCPKYGFRLECDGEPLSLFFEKNEMFLPSDDGLQAELAAWNKASDEDFDLFED